MSPVLIHDGIAYDVATGLTVARPDPPPAPTGPSEPAEDGPEIHTVHIGEKLVFKVPSPGPPVLDDDGQPTLCATCSTQLILHPDIYRDAWLCVPWHADMCPYGIEVQRWRERVLANRPQPREQEAVYLETPNLPSARLSPVRAAAADALTPDQADAREAQYWSDHLRVTEALALCAPEVTLELIDLIRAGATPSFGWWARRLPADQYLPGIRPAPEPELVPA